MGEDASSGASAPGKAAAAEPAAWGRAASIAARSCALCARHFGVCIMFRNPNY